MFGGGIKDIIRGDNGILGRHVEEHEARGIIDLFGIWLMHTLLLPNHLGRGRNRGLAALQINLKQKLCPNSQNLRTDHVKTDRAHIHGDRPPLNKGRRNRFVRDLGKNFRSKKPSVFDGSHGHISLYVFQVLL